MRSLQWNTIPTSSLTIISITNLPSSCLPSTFLISTLRSHPQCLIPTHLPTLRVPHVVSRVSKAMCPLQKSKSDHIRIRFASLRETISFPFFIHSHIRKWRAAALFDSYLIFNKTLVYLFNPVPSSANSQYSKQHKPLPPVSSVRAMNPYIQSSSTLPRLFNPDIYPSIWFTLSSPGLQPTRSLPLILHLISLYSLKEQKKSSSSSLQRSLKKRMQNASTNACVMRHMCF